MNTSPLYLYILLPEIESKKEFIKYKNFCIEFMFDEQYLTTQVDGKGLVLTGETIETFNGITISKNNASETWFKTIETSSKTYFSDKIGPTLPIEACENFKILFDIVNSIIENN